MKLIDIAPFEALLGQGELLPFGIRNGTSGRMCHRIIICFVYW